MKGTSAFRSALIAASMLGFAGAQRLDAKALIAHTDEQLLRRAAENPGLGHTRNRSQPGQGRGVGHKLSKPRNTMSRGW